MKLKAQHVFCADFPSPAFFLFFSGVSLCSASLSAPPSLFYVVSFKIAPRHTLPIDVSLELCVWRLCAYVFTEYKDVLIFFPSARVLL